MWEFKGVDLKSGDRLLDHMRPSCIRFRASGLRVLGLGFRGGWLGCNVGI